MRDEKIVERQVGREPRGFVRVATRCPLGLPETIVTKPIVETGSAGAKTGGGGAEPFPTVFWLTCPGAVRAVSALEALGWVRKLQDRLASDPVALEAYREASKSYTDFRLSLLSAEEASRLAKENPRKYEVVARSGIGGVLQEPGIAGVKCLHAHYADYLARGVNPIGRWVRELLTRGARGAAGSDAQALE